MPRRSASTGLSSARWSWRRNFSAGDSSTSGAAQIERNVPRRSAPFGVGACGGDLEAEGAGVGHRPARRGRALGPAHAAPAELVERQAGVERDRLEELRRRHRAAQHREVVAEARGEVGDDVPLRAHRVGPRDRRAQALHAPVGVRDRALLLGVGLGGEDDVGELPQPLAEEVGVRDDGLGLLERRAPHAPVGQVAQRVGVHEVQRAEVAGGGGGADPVAVEADRADRARRPGAALGSMPTSRRPRPFVPAGSSSRPEPSWSALTTRPATFSSARAAWPPRVPCVSRSP